MDLSRLGTGNASFNKEKMQIAVDGTIGINSGAEYDMHYFLAASFYRRRGYQKCNELCNEILKVENEKNNTVFPSPNNENIQQAHLGENQKNYLRKNSQKSRTSFDQPQTQGLNTGGKSKFNMQRNVPAWIKESIWEIKMRALTQRVYVDDLETDDVYDMANEETDLERIATAARPGTSIKVAFIPRPLTRSLESRDSKSRCSTSSYLKATSSGEQTTERLKTPSGNSITSRPSSRCGTASRTRSVLATSLTFDDKTAPLYQASRLNPSIYAENQKLIKTIFQFLFYHESDPQKAYVLCEAVLRIKSIDWWWQQQIGRCLLALRQPKKAELYLQQSLSMFPHPDTYILLSRLYQVLNEPKRSLDLIVKAVDQHPFNITFRMEQARILEIINQDETIQLYCLITKLNPINVEALAYIGVKYFYENNPELALMYFKRILSLGLHSTELYCNIALCCLYGGQIELVLPCFQRGLLTAKTSKQKADLWYNLSFVAITTGDFKLARRCLQLCLTFDNRNAAALNNLAILYAQSDNILFAKSHLNAAKEISIDSIEVNMNLKYFEKQIAKARFLGKQQGQV
ncbi:tetratricopeptide repeat protein 8 [Teleopsis dalmanni]|uniref:tetratricopeptide repeat protein 8 n=1 Tax=Teleopsis dalmanni TaxID=139649 RepID=UPI0018CF08D4|nr:tetratricopeptide repeat protein 8 [Teleopsis dalmanni]